MGPSGDLNDLLGVGAAIVGLAVGVARYATVLRHGTRKEVETASAWAFFGGLVIATAAMAILVIRVT